MFNVVMSFMKVQLNSKSILVFPNFGLEEDDSFFIPKPSQLKSDECFQRFLSFMTFNRHIALSTKAHYSK